MGVFSTPFSTRELDPRYKHKIPIRGYDDEQGNLIELISPRDLNAMKTPFLSICLKLFQEWKIFKVLPHGGGTLEERQVILDILTLLEHEYNEFEAWEMEKKKKTIPSPSISHRR